MRARDDDWAEAKRLCRLSAEDLRMARALGLSPRTLSRNIPSPTQRWKAPVREWVRDLYRKRHGVAEGPERAIAAAAGADVEDCLPGRRAGDDAWRPGDRARREEIREEDRALLRRQRDFRAAADHVAFAFARSPFVERVALIGSVAQPLRREVPRFGRLRRAGVELWHECKDVDLAVWVTDTTQLESLRKALGRAVNALFAESGIGVAHHQVDVFLLEPGTDRYLGRLCHFGTCPKGKPECLVPGCGGSLFLRRHEGFSFDVRCLDAARSVVLFDRAGDRAPESPAPPPSRGAS